MHVGKTKLENSISSFKNSSSGWNLSLNSLSSEAGKHLIWTIFLVEPHRTWVLDTRVLFLHFLLSSFVLLILPFLLVLHPRIHRIRAKTKTQTQTQKSRSQHWSGSLSLGLLISALERLGFVDLGTGAHLGLMFSFAIVAWFCCFLGLLSSDVGLGF